MTELNSYLRRADVEEVLNFLIDAEDVKIKTINSAVDSGVMQDFRIRANTTKSALVEALNSIRAREQFTLHDGYESNEAGIAELRDAEGNNVEPDNRRWKSQ